MKIGQLQDGVAVELPAGSPRMPTSTSFSGGTRIACWTPIAASDRGRDADGVADAIGHADNAAMDTAMRTAVRASSSSCSSASRTIAPNAQLNSATTGRGNSGENTEPDESPLQR